MNSLWKYITLLRLGIPIKKAVSDLFLLNKKTSMWERSTPPLFFHLKKNLISHLFSSIYFVCIYLNWKRCNIQGLSQLSNLCRYCGLGTLLAGKGRKHMGLFVTLFSYSTPCRFGGLKGTQDWDIFWLRFWNLYYFFISYVKILRFYKKICWSGHFWGRYDFSV